MFVHHEAGIPAIHQLKMVQEVKKLVEEMKKCNFNKTNSRKANENINFKKNSLFLHYPLFCWGCGGAVWD